MIRREALRPRQNRPPREPAISHLVTFRSSKFDPAAEPENPHNPIAGHALLLWLSAAVRAADFTCGEPDAEDWGWYLDVSGHDATYLLGASGESEEGGDGSIDWTIQINRHRSFTDKLRGRNVQTSDDALTAVVERAVRGEPAFKNVEVDRSAA